MKVPLFLAAERIAVILKKDKVFKTALPGDWEWKCKKVQPWSFIFGKFWSIEGEQVSWKHRAREKEAQRLSQALKETVNLEEPPGSGHQ